MKYDFKTVEQHGRSRGRRGYLPCRDRPFQAEILTRWSSSRTRPPRACTSAIRVATPHWTSSRAKSASAAIASCTPWLGRFGLPTENYALKNHINPEIVTAQNVARFKSQLKALGLSFDWDREINTTDPEYYKWTQ